LHHKYMVVFQNWFASMWYHQWYQAKLQGRLMITPVKFQQNMFLFSCPRLNTNWAVRSASNMTGPHPKPLHFKIACQKYGLVLLFEHENFILFSPSLKTWKRDIFIILPVIMILRMTQFED
jgi:hypothetical protein